MKLIIFVCLLCIGCATDPQPSISYKVENPDGKKFNAHISTGVDGLQQHQAINGTVSTGSFKLAGSQQFWIEITTTDQPLQITIGGSGYSTVYQLPVSLTFKYK